MALIILCLIYRYLHNVNIKCISTSGLHLSYIHCNHSFLIQKITYSYLTYANSKGTDRPQPANLATTDGDPMLGESPTKTLLSMNCSWGELLKRKKNVTLQMKWDRQNLFRWCAVWCLYGVHVKNNKKIEIIYCIAVF